MDSRKDSSSNEEGLDASLLHQNGHSNSPHSYKKTSSRWSSIDGRRLLFATCACLAAASLFGLLSVMIWTQQYRYRDSIDQEGPHSQSPAFDVSVPITNLPLSEPEPEPKIDKWGPLSVLLGPPTESFRDNLRNDTKYISTWPSAGWTNDVMTYANMIYLAVITDRVPVLPPFVPSHIGGDAGSIHFGDVFNTTRLGESIGIPVIEWRDLKRPGSPLTDELGCWDVWQSTQYDEKFPRRSGMLTQLNLDVSYTRTPAWVKLIPGEVNDKHATFWSLASLAFPDIRKQELVPPRPSDLHQVTLPPDEQFLCFDYLYYVCAQKPFEYSYDYSPAWRRAAQYMRWTDRLDQIADSYVRKTIGMADGLATPRYISVHVRHSDFGNWCGDIPQKDCFAPVPVIARRVREVQEELLAKKGIDVKDVIITSDEQDPAWWDEVAELGWKSPDHSNTKAEYGRWYPVLIDAVIQSNGVGFVGTDRSTMSEMAERRCQSWHDGVTRMVLWGSVGADDH